MIEATTASTTTTPGAHRRRFLAGAALALLTGTGAAVAARGASASIQTADNPDAELIGLCGRLIAIEGEIDRLYDVPERPSDEEEIAAEDERDRILDGMAPELHALEERLWELPNPVTLAGATAVARVVLAQWAKSTEGRPVCHHAGDSLTLMLAQALDDGVQS